MTVSYKYTKVVEPGIHCLYLEKKVGYNPQFRIIPYNPR